MLNPLSSLGVTHTYDIPIMMYIIMKMNNLKKYLIRQHIMRHKTKKLYIESFKRFLHIWINAICLNYCFFNFFSMFNNVAILNSFPIFLLMMSEMEYLHDCLVIIWIPIDWVSNPILQQVLLQEDHRMVIMLNYTILH